VVSESDGLAVQMLWKFGRAIDREAPISEVGHPRLKWAVRALSGLPWLATELRTSKDVRSVQLTEYYGTIFGGRGE